MAVPLRMAAVAVMCGLAFGTPPAAQAKGIARIQESDGAIRQYDVSLKVVDHRALRITSADGRGTLVIGKAACSFAGALERCLPYREYGLDSSNLTLVSQ